MVINFVWKIKREILERKKKGESMSFFFNICKIVFLIKERKKELVLSHFSVSKPPLVFSSINNWYQSLICQKT